MPLFFPARPEDNPMTDQIQAAPRPMAAACLRDTHRGVMQTFPDP
jgi:hypothetical protein